MYLLILGLPFLGFGLCGLGGRYLGGKGSGYLATGLIGGASVLSLVALYEVGVSGTVVNLGLGFMLSSIDVVWGGWFDSVSVLLLVVVSLISFLVHAYSIGYMDGDPHQSRFMSYLSFFTLTMMILIVSPSILQLFVGWEGVGVSSYLLINFWYTRMEANKAALKAMILNRIGDVGVIIGLVGLYALFGSTQFEVIFGLVDYLQLESIRCFGYDWNGLSFIMVCLFIGVMGKSAQVGLHVWLPDAMEGPTPVSALIHAATMVTAGVFLMIRVSPILDKTPGVAGWIAFIGGITALMAATIALVQNDLKKVIAYSTCSQLGYMVLGCGVLNYTASFFHLVNHAFFKALLFLGAGSVIHGRQDEQDMRRLGRLTLPFTYSALLVGSLSILGFPFLTGFYSKEYVLSTTMAEWTLSSTFGYVLGVVTALLTAFYSIRLLWLGCLDFPKNRKEALSYENRWLSVALLVLIVGSIWGGYVLKELIIGTGTGFWNGALEMREESDGEFLPKHYQGWVLSASFIGMLSAFLIYGIGEEEQKRWKLKLRQLYQFLIQSWYVDLISQKWLVKWVLQLGYQTTFKLLDRGILDMIGPSGLVRLVERSSIGLKRLHTGSFYQAVILMLMGMGLVFYGIPLWCLGLFLWTLCELEQWLAC
jgi:proton-translocating NADH-quinone oxidoreductase chain L